MRAKWQRQSFAKHKLRAIRAALAEVWADVTAGPNTIGVTDVLVWRADLGEWRSVDRATVCREELLPSTIYRHGCFSN